MTKLNIKLVNNQKHINEKNLVDYIKKTVCDYYGLDISMLDVNTRRKEVTKVRQVSIYLIAKYSNMSSILLGWFFNRDHATILYAIKTVNGYLDYDKEFKKEIEELHNIISVKAKLALEDYDFNQDFYFIDLDNFDSIKINDNKAVILVGFNENELNDFKSINNLKGKFKNHIKKGMYILDKQINNEKNENTESSKS